MRKDERHADQRHDVPFLLFLCVYPKIPIQSSLRCPLSGFGYRASFMSQDLIHAAGAHRSGDERATAAGMMTLQAAGLRRELAGGASWRTSRSMVVNARPVRGALPAARRDVSILKTIVDSGPVTTRQ
jgi:hypothetical protein